MYKTTHEKEALYASKLSFASTKKQHNLPEKALSILSTFYSFVMTLAIMQPYIFPYLGYYQLISAVDKFVVYDDVNFIKRGWINRNSLLSNGGATLFSIPLKDASQNRLINEIRLHEDNTWRTKFLRTIELSYKKAPFFKFVYPLVKDVIMTDASYISQLAVHSLQAVCAYLSIDTAFETSSTIYNNRHLKGRDRIIDICEKEKADHYINPIGGREIYTSKHFEEKGIRLNFIEMKLIPYKQSNDGFVPYLSVIDVLMFNSREEVRQLLSQYQLIGQSELAYE